MNTAETPKSLSHCDAINRIGFGNLTVWEGLYEYRAFPEDRPELTKYRLITEGEKVWMEIYTGTLYGSTDYDLLVSADHDDAEEGWGAWDSIADFDRMVREARKLGAGLMIENYHKGDKKRGKKGKFVTLAKS